MRKPLIFAALWLGAAGALHAGSIADALSGLADVKVPVPAAPAAVAAPAAPEYAYEALLAGPLWRPAAGKPGAVDLRASFPPARSQGKRNMCNVFAANALAEFLVNARDGKGQAFSEEFLFYDTKYNYTARPELAAYRTTDGLAGYAAVLGLQGGVVAAADWPFAGDWRNPAPRPPVTDAEVGVPPQGIAGKVLGYKFAPQAVRRAEIKYFLAAERRPVVINLMLYFKDVAASGPAGRLTQPSPDQRNECAASGDNCGGHVVLLTGYDPKTSEYIFRNSWGPGWGDGGYGRVPEKYVLEDCEACGHIAGLPGFGADDRTMIVNSSYGWSAVLK
jgi:hypothetical protein